MLWRNLNLSGVTLLTDHICDGCIDYKKGICTTGPKRFPDCWSAGEIVTPLERKLNREFSKYLSEFKLNSDT
jgi:hypothetical protein